MSNSPPKLLTGLALLYWGYMTGNLSAAIPAAILLESKSVVNLRWDFKYESYIKAWNLCILCALLTVMISWINGMRVGSIHTLFVWAPFIMLPIELAQRFGTSKTIPLSIFSYFARKKMLRDIKEGASISPRVFNSGYPYIAVVILATAKASRHDLFHYIGLSLLVGICLYAYNKNRGRRTWAWSCAFIILLALSWAGQWSMYKLSRYYRGGKHEITINQNMSATERRTSIGRLGRIKLNPNIHWRMRTHAGAIPRLLRSATYNQYDRARWFYQFQASSDSANEYDEFGYRSYSTKMTAESMRDIRWFTRSAPRLSEEAPISIIGEIEAKIREHPIPVPSQFIAIGDLDEEADVECNSLGTIRMANPNYNVVEYAAWIGDFSNTEEPPTSLDLQITPTEADALKRICNQLELYNPSLDTQTKIKKLRNFFIDNFTYSTHLTTPRFDRGKRDSSVGLFLEDSRTGHCEYFATATTLLLREAGIPARYSIGYAVNERGKSKNEWVMRGLHAHAWSRVWLEQANNSGGISGKWVDVDLTPPSWQAMEAINTNHWKQRLADGWQRAREDFLIWRTREANKTRVYVVLSAILSIVAIWVGWRLWSSRQRKTNAVRHPYKRPKDAADTPLYKLEPLITKKIGQRPIGTPYCIWLHQLLSEDVTPHDELKKILLPAMALHSAIRFDPERPRTDQQHELNKLTVSLRQLIKSLPNHNRARG